MLEPRIGSCANCTGCDRLGVEILSTFLVLSVAWKTLKGGACTCADYNLCHFWSNFEMGDLRWFRSKPYQVRRCRPLAGPLRIRHIAPAATLPLSYQITSGLPTYRHHLLCHVNAAQPAPIGWPESVSHQTGRPLAQTWCSSVICRRTSNTWTKPEASSTSGALRSSPSDAPLVL